MAIQIIGTLANPGDLVTLGGPDATPALVDESTACAELIGTFTAGSVFFEVAGPLSNTWYSAICWTKAAPNALLSKATNTSGPNLYVIPVAACVGVRARAGPNFVGNLVVGLIAAGGSPVAYPGATIT